jgi:hypothetical protein
VFGFSLEDPHYNAEIIFDNSGYEKKQPKKLGT